MNRIELPTVSFASHQHSAGAVPLQRRRNRFRGRAIGPEITPCTTFSPIHYEERYAYPLIIWLHGAAGNERQLQRVITEISMRNYVGIAPRGTEADPCRSAAFAWRQTDDGIEEAEARVFDCIAIASDRFHVHSDRVFIAGVGCGGTMAMRLAWSHPDRFAGAASFGGPLPSHRRPLRNVNALRQLPCFLASGRTSRDYPEADVCRDLRLLHTAGCTVALRQYPCGDELSTTMLADLNRWIMDLVTA